MTRQQHQSESVANSVNARGLAICVVLSALLLSTGCGDGRHSVNAVCGKVMYKGHGVPQTTVVFFPVEPIEDNGRKLKPFAYGENDGSFQLKTYVTGDGAPPGKYRVGIMAPMATDTTSKKDRPVEDKPAGAVVKIPA